MFCLIKSAFVFIKKKNISVCHTSYARLVEGFMLVPLCEVEFKDGSSSSLSVCVGFLYSVVRSSLLSRFTKQSRKESFPFSSISLIKWMSTFCSLKCLPRP